MRGTMGAGWRRAAGAVLVVFLAACGSSGGDAGGGGGSGNNNGTGAVGPSGGNVSLPSGPALQVPAGALGTATTLTIAASSVAAPAGARGGVYDFGPSGTVFATPVTVSFPVSAGTAASDVAIYWTKRGSTTSWDVLPATVANGVATAQVTHFSSGFVGMACTAGVACTPADACHVGATTCNGTLACSDTGAAVADGTTCGGTNVCTAGVCGPPPTTCTPGVACTPSGTPSACKTYATSCDASGSSTCGVSGNQPDGTACGSGLVCSAGTCGTPSSITVTGRVVNVWSVPQAGLKVWVVGAAGNQVTDANGSFTFQGVKTPYQLVVQESASEWFVMDGLTRVDPVINLRRTYPTTENTAPVTVTVTGATAGQPVYAFLTAPRSFHVEIPIPTFTAPSGTAQLVWKGAATITGDLHLYQQGAASWNYAVVRNQTFVAGQAASVTAALAVYPTATFSATASVPPGGPGINGVAVVLGGDQTGWLSNPVNGTVTYPALPGGEILVMAESPSNYTSCAIVPTTSPPSVVLQVATGAVISAPTAGSTFDLASGAIAWSPLSSPTLSTAFYTLFVLDSTIPSTGPFVELHTSRTSYRLADLQPMGVSFRSGSSATASIWGEAGKTIDEDATGPRIWCPAQSAGGPNVAFKVQ